jgi:hypothetical protein
MKQLTESDLDNLDLYALVERMDEILAAPHWYRHHNRILKISVRSLITTRQVQLYSPAFQRKIAYKAFGLILQLLYTQFSTSAQFFRVPGADDPIAEQLYDAARQQWTIISSQVVFEYLMHLLYMLGTGQDFPSGKGASKRFKKWLKEPHNPYTFFAIAAAHSLKFGHEMRRPEVHAATKLARRILLTSVSDLSESNKTLYLLNVIQSQWQFVIQIAESGTPHGWAATGRAAKEDEEWYSLWKSGAQERMNQEIDKMFNDDDAVLF